MRSSFSNGDVEQVIDSPWHAPKSNYCMHWSQWLTGAKSCHALVTKYITASRFSSLGYLCCKCEYTDTFWHSQSESYQWFPINSFMVFRFSVPFNFTVRKNESMLNKLSRGEICLTNFIPPANGASLGSYFCVQLKLHWLGGWHSHW